MPAIEILQDGEDIGIKISTGEGQYVFVELFRSSGHGSRILAKTLVNGEQLIWATKIILQAQKEGDE